MRHRPWEIVLLTLVYAVAPVANLAFTCLVRGYELSAIPWLLLAMTPLDWAALLVYPCLATAVWSVSRPGWWIFLVLNALLFMYNFYVASLVPGANLWIVAGGNLLNVGVASLLFTKHARSPYFSPRLRWWNSEVRYRVVYVLDVPVKIQYSSGEGTGLLLDLSLTGCFVQIDGEVHPDGPVELEFSCWGLTIRCQGRILRRANEGEKLRGYGIQFQSLTRAQKHHLNSLVKVLKAHKVPSREEQITIQRQPRFPQAPQSLSGSSSAEVGESPR